MAQVASELISVTRDEKLADSKYIKDEALENKKQSDINKDSLSGGVYNVTKLRPLQSEYYTITTAIAAIPQTLRCVGMVITYQTGENSWETKQFKGVLSDFTDSTKWEDFGGASDDYDDVLNIETTEGTPASGGGTTEVAQVVDTYQYTQNTYNSATMNDGHYYIMPVTGQNYLKRFQDANATAYIVEVFKGDKVTIYLTAPTTYHVICFSPKDNRDNLESGAQSIDANNSQVYEATAPYDGYAYISTKYGVSYIRITKPIVPAVPPTKRSVRLDNIESSIGDLDDSISDINDSIAALSDRIDSLSPSGDTPSDDDETPELSYYGERNGGTFNSNSNTTLGVASSGTAVTVELLFRVESLDSTYDIFSPTQNKLFRINIANNGGVKNLVLRGLVNGDSDASWKAVSANTMYHIVFTASNNGGTITKKIYMDGTPIKTVSGTPNTYKMLEDNLAGGNRVTYFTRRIWARELSALEVATLYNEGKPIGVNIEGLRTNLVSNLESSGLSSTGWYDSVEDRTHTLGANVILEPNNPFASDDTPSGDQSDDTPSGDTSDLANRVTAIENRFGVFREITYPEFDVLTLTHNAHDCTFYDDDTILSAGWDGVGWLTWRSITTGTASVIKAQFKAESININYYNELKSIDYKFGKLLVGSGRAKKNDSSYETQGSYVLIFNDVANWKENSTTAYNTAPIKTLDNCGIYKKIDFDIALGVKSYAFWAHTDDTIYLNTNFFKDVYLIRLGKGTQKLESGIFTSAEEGLYNGSYEILNHWHQGENWLQDGEPIAAHGGQFYRGHLFLAVNIVDKCVVYKCILNNDDTLRFDAIHLDEYMESNPNKLKYRYIDGLCFHDGKMYAQPLNVDDSNENNLSYYLVTEV